jgi:mitogen-activated protein kinase 1/3
VHRDLKPANVLIDQDCNISVCDFGLAKSLPKVKRPMTAHVASRWYRAPEVIVTSGEYSSPMDMWSLGCILAELIAFTNPYREGTKNNLTIFPGTSCYPGSPCEEMRKSKKNDV